MMNLIKLSILSIVLTLSTNAYSLVEFSIGYQGLYSSTVAGNWVGTSALPGSGAYGLTGDLRFNIPFMGLGLGLRYGDLGISGTSGAYTIDMKNNSVSALLSYRLIDTGILLGPVVTYALTNTGTLTHSIGSPSTATAGTVSQYTAGIEFGLKFPILISVEAGVGSLNMSSFSGNQTLLGTATKVEITGTYAKAGVGFSF